MVAPPNPEPTTMTSWSVRSSSISASHPCAAAQNLVVDGHHLVEHVVVAGCEALDHVSPAAPSHLREPLGRQSQGFGEGLGEGSRPTGGDLPARDARVRDA